jgi:hypothetical protein
VLQRRRASRPRCSCTCLREDGAKLEFTNGMQTGARIRRISSIRRVFASCFVCRGRTQSAGLFASTTECGVFSQCLPFERGTSVRARSPSRNYRGPSSGNARRQIAASLHDGANRSRRPKSFHHLSRYRTTRRHNAEATIRGPESPQRELRSVHEHHRCSAGILV